MGKSTISMAIFNSFFLVYQRVTTTGVIGLSFCSFWSLPCLDPQPKRFTKSCQTKHPKLEQKSEPTLFGGAFPCSFSVLPSKSGFFKSLFSHRTLVPWEAQVQSSLFLDVSQVGNFQVSIHLPIGMMQILFYWWEIPVPNVGFNPCSMAKMRNGCPGVSQTLLGLGPRVILWYWPIGPSPSLLRTALFWAW